MRTIKATFVSIDEAEFTSLQSTTALGGAFSPITPLSADIFLGNFIAWSFINHWGRVKCAFACLPSSLLRLSALSKACLPLLFVCFARESFFAMLVLAILIESLFAQLLWFDRLSSEIHACTCLESQFG